MKGGYSFKNQAFDEIQEAINANHSNAKNAFQFFLSHEQEINPQAKEITYSGFQKAINDLIPKRFEANDLSLLWKKCAEEAQCISINRFEQLFDNNKFTGSQYVSPTKYRLLILVK